MVLSPPIRTEEVSCLVCGGTASAQHIHVIPGYLDFVRTYMVRKD